MDTRADVFTRLRSILAVFTMTAIVLAGCLAVRRPAAPTPEPKGGGGEFRVVLSAEPVSLNPDLRSDDAAVQVINNIYNKLVTLDADYRVIPDLAESWDVTADGLTYTFHLAPNVRWHDGQPFTAADVKWSFEAIAASKGIGQPIAAHVSEIQIPDATTVVMKLQAPWSPFIPNMAWLGTFILPKHLYEGKEWGANPADNAPVGTGPFKFVEWVKGDHITLTANPDYFRRGPYLDQLTFRILKDPSAAAVELLGKGAVDYTLARPAFERLPELQHTPGVQVRTFPHPARYYVGFNLRRQPWDDLRVRQAVNTAINRLALVDKALRGYGAPGLGFYTPAVAWAYNPKAQTPAYDAVAAEQLLDAAGRPRRADGTRLKLSLVTSSASPFKELGQTLAEQLRAVGLETEVVLLAAADYSKRVVEQHDFDLALTDGTWGPDPENLNLRFGATGANQFMGYASAAFDAAIAEGGRQVKLEDRVKAYFSAQEILSVDLPLAPLAEYVQVLTYRDTVTGLPQVEARGLVTFYDFSLVRVKH